MDNRVLREVERSIGNLKPHLRSALLLPVEYSYAKSARKLGVTKEKLKERVRCARDQIARDLLGDGWQDPESMAVLATYIDTAAIMMRAKHQVGISTWRKMWSLIATDKPNSSSPARLHLFPAVRLPLAAGALVALLLAAYLGTGLLELRSGDPDPGHVSVADSKGAERRVAEGAAAPVGSRSVTPPSEADESVGALADQDMTPRVISVREASGESLSEDYHRVRESSGDLGQRNRGLERRNGELEVRQKTFEIRREGLEDKYRTVEMACAENRWHGLSSSGRMESRREDLELRRVDLELRREDLELRRENLELRRENLELRRENLERERVGIEEKFLIKGSEYEQDFRRYMQLLEEEYLSPFEEEYLSPFEEEYLSSLERYLSSLERYLVDIENIAGILEVCAGDGPVRAASA